MKRNKFIDIISNSIKLVSSNDIYPDSVFFYYDVNSLRSLKINTILKNNTPELVLPTNININNMIMDQDTQSKIFWVDHSIWDNINKKYPNANTIICEWLGDGIMNKKCKSYTVFGDNISKYGMINDIKWKLYEK